MTIEQSLPLRYETRTDKLTGDSWFVRSNAGAVAVVVSSEADAQRIISSCNAYESNRLLLKRAADKLQEYCESANGDLNDSLAMEIYRAIGE